MDRTSYLLKYTSRRTDCVTSEVMKNHCKLTVCSSDSLAYDGQCIKLYESIASKHDRFQRIKIKYICPESEFSTFTRDTLFTLNFKNSPVEDCYNTSPKFVEINQSTKCGIIHITHVSSAEIYNLYNFYIEALQHLAKSLYCMLTLQVSASEKCTIGKPYRAFNPALSLHGQKMFYVDYTIRYTFANYIYLTYSGFGEDSTVTVTTCFLHIQLCDRVLVEPGDFTVLHNYSSVKLKTGHIIEWGKFAVVNASHILICSQALSPVSSALKYLTLAGNIISILSLILTLAVYTAVPDMRTVPGKLLMQYMTVLMLSQILFQFNDYCVGYLVFCKVLAALLHYSWLATFTCITTQALIMAKTFVTHAYNVLPNGVSYAGYAVSSMLLPLLVVVPCVIMDVTDTGWFYYGDELNCWISNAGVIDRFYAFSIPTLILILCNLLLFIICGTSMLITFLQLQSINSQRDHFFILLVFLKLFSLMGLSWLFGFLPDVTGNPAYWYPFTIFSCLQGLYVFLAFGCSSVARKHVRHLLSTTPQ